MDNLLLWIIATGIGSHDDAVTLGEHAVDDLQLFRGGDVRDHAPVRAYLAGDQAERYGQHWQLLRRRFRVTVNVRHGQRHEVSQRPGYHVSVAGTVAVISCISPDYTGYVQAYARFFLSQVNYYPKLLFLYHCISIVYLHYFILQLWIILFFI